MKEALLKKVKEKQWYLYDIPCEVSTTGSLPSRGLYCCIVLDDDTCIWTDNKDREIQDYRWVEKLNNLK